MSGEPMARPRFKNILYSSLLLNSKRDFVSFVDFGHYMVPYCMLLISKSKCCDTVLILYNFLVLLIRIPIDLALLDPDTYIGNADPDPGARKSMGVYDYYLHKV